MLLIVVAVLVIAAIVLAFLGLLEIPSRLRLIAGSVLLLAVAVGLNLIRTHHGG